MRCYTYTTLSTRPTSTLLKNQNSKRISTSHAIKTNCSIVRATIFMRKNFAFVVCKAKDNHPGLLLDAF